MTDRVGLFLSYQSQNIPLVLINWTPEEQKMYADTTAVVYPNIVTLSQIYSMMCQRLMEDGVIMSGETPVVDPHTNIDPITHQPIEAVTAVERLSKRLSASSRLPPLDAQVVIDLLPPPKTCVTKMKSFLLSVKTALKAFGSHYIYRGVFILLNACDIVLLLLAILGFFFNYRLTWRYLCGVSRRTAYLCFAFLFIFDWLLRCNIVNSNYRIAHDVVSPRGGDA